MRTLALLILPLLLFAPRGWAAPPTGAAALSPRVEIDRIEVTGVTVLRDHDVEAALEISPGDRLDRAKVVRTEESIQALYRIRGYEQVSIQSKLNRMRGEGGTMESVLEFAVQEGRPTRIAAVELVPESVRDEVFQKLWKRLESSLVTRLGLAAGDIYDQDKVSAGKRAIQDVLAGEEFVGAKVDDIRVSTAESRGPPAGRWVKLELHVDLGDRVSFGFRGNTVFTQVQLAGFVTEQRVLGFGKDYVGAIRTRIEDEYRALGYPNAQAFAYTFERPSRQERHVTFEISEGPRVDIDSVDFDGNSIFNGAELRDQFFNRGSPILQNRHFVEKDVEKAAELVVEWMKSKGYLAAKLVTINTVSAMNKKYKNPNKAQGRNPFNSVRLVIYLYEGDQTLIESVSFKGVETFPPEEVKKMLGVQEGAPLNLIAFTEGIEQLKAAYRAKGYLGIRVVNEGTDQVIRYTQENRYADVEVEISEGPQYKVSKIQTEGLSQTDEDIVLRELTFREGDVLEEPKINASEARLRRLGIFSVVTIRTLDDPQALDRKIVRVSLQEGTPGLVGGGIGFRNDLGVRLFGELGYTNIFGRNQTVTFGANVNRRFEDYRFIEYQVQLGYIYPWFSIPDLTFRPTVSRSETQYIILDAQTTSAALSWEYPLIKKWNVTGLFTYSLEGIKQFNSKDKVDNQEIRIGTVSPSVRIDQRDSALTPTRGWYASGSFELAAPWLLSQSDPFPIGYYRFQVRGDKYVPLPMGMTWYFSARTGVERSNEGPVEGIDPSGAIPFIKEFALGGASSLRGFKEQELNLESRLIRGLAAYWNYRTQLDFPFSGALRIGPFVDAANLTVDRISPVEDLRFGAGVGLHYQSPVGPVNLDWGFKWKPRPNEDRFRFYFSIGVI